MCGSGSAGGRFVLIAVFDAEDAIAGVKDGAGSGMFQDISGRQDERIHSRLTW